MFVALHWTTFKPALPNMPAAAVMLVITPYVTGQEPLHESGSETADAKLQSESESDSASERKQTS